MADTRLATGSDNGLIKIYDPKAQKTTLWGKQVRDKEITSFVWKNNEKTQILFGDKSGEVQTLDSISEASVSTMSFPNSVVGLHSFDDKRLLGCDSQGNVGILTEDTKEKSAFMLNRPVRRILVSTAVASGCQTQLPASALGRFVVLGGQGKLAQLIDVEKQKPIWSARNLPNDFLGLQIPINDTDGDWIDAQHTFVAVTAHYHIRLYDVRAQCKPTFTCSPFKQPYNCVRTNPNNKNEIAIADSLGNVRLHDVRKEMRTLGNLRGFAGAVRSLAYHPTEPLIAAVGLDRFLHVCNTNTRKHTFKVYLKQRMNHVLWAHGLPKPKDPSDEVESNSSGSDEDNDSIQESDEDLLEDDSEDISDIEDESDEMDEE